MKEKLNEIKYSIPVIILVLNTLFSPGCATNPKPIENNKQATVYLDPGNIYMMCHEGGIRLFPDTVYIFTLDNDEYSFEYSSVDKNISYGIKKNGKYTELVNAPHTKNEMETGVFLVLSSKLNGDRYLRITFGGGGSTLLKLEDCQGSD